MSSSSARYRELVADLVAASRRHAAATATAHEAYADGAAAIEHDLSAAEDAVSTASSAVALAQRSVAQTDLAAAAIWDDLKQVRGRRGKRLGLVPDPGSSTHTDPAALLESASTRVERARRGGEPLPPMILPVLFILGGVAAGIVTLLAIVVGWLLLLPAPLAGLPVARHWVDHRFGSRLDPGAIGVLILGGMLATAGIWITLR